MNELILTLGMSVQCADGSGGKLGKIALDPNNGRITYLLVEDGLLLKSRRAVPLENVSRATADDLVLDCTKDELSAFPAFRERRIDVPVETSGQTMVQDGYGMSAVPGLKTRPETVYEGIPNNHLVADKSTRVETGAGPVGKLRSVIAEADTGGIIYLVTGNGVLSGYELEIPVSVVSSYSPQAIFLSITAEEAVERYRLDEDDELVRTAEPAGPFDETLPEAPAGLPEAVSAPTAAQATLTAESNLSSEISAALLSDPRTSSAVVDVIVDRSNVILSGTAPNQAAREAAEELARQYPGVNRVENTISVR